MVWQHFMLVSFNPARSPCGTVCQGTACHVRGAAKILEAMQKELGIGPGETTEDLRFTLEPVACLGCCGLAPVMMINENTHGRLTPDGIADILAQYE